MKAFIERSVDIYAKYNVGSNVEVIPTSWDNLVPQKQFSVDEISENESQSSDDEMTIAERMFSDLPKKKTPKRR